MNSEQIGLVDFLGLKETVFAFFLLAGMFKAMPVFDNFPLDLTVLAALLTLAFVVYRFLRLRERHYRLLFLLVAFFLTFAPTLLWTHWHDYAIEKASRFYTLTLLAAVAPIYVLRTRKELRRFLAAFTLISGVAVVSALVNLVTTGKDVERLVALSASAISLARAGGVVFLFLTVWFFRSKTNLLIIIVSLIPLVILLVAVGERGPLLGTALAFIAVYLLFQRKTRTGLAKTVLLIVAVFAIFRFSMSWIPETSLSRVGTFLGGELGDSELERVDFFQFSVSNISRHPLGLGLGGFDDLYRTDTSVNRLFPHNILLETFLEGGWFAGVYLVWLSWRSLSGSYTAASKQRSYPEFQFLFGLLVFFLANDQISGELNDSKALFVFIGLCVGFGMRSYRGVRSPLAMSPRLRPLAPYSPEV